MDHQITKRELSLRARPIFFSVQTGLSPVVATAIHDGHFVDSSATQLMALEKLARRREEDPYTGFIIEDVPNHLINHRSRFALDLNRARDKAVYLSAEDAWGLTVWKTALPNEIIEALRIAHDEYYLVLKAVLDGVVKRYGRLIVLDVHSYNHRRDGPEAEPTAAEKAPDVNIGTYSMDRHRWKHVLEPFMEHLRSRKVKGRFLDVRENVAFEGKGEQTRFIHSAFPETGCAIAVEFKKFFMDEWTGEPDRSCLHELRSLITDAIPVLEVALGVQPS